MRTGVRQHRRSRRGLVLPLVIGIAVVLAILGIGFMQMGYGSRLMAAVTMSQISARAAADAGLTRAIYAMNMNYRDPSNPWPVNGAGTLADPYASYNYAVSPVAPLIYQIDSTGTSGRETRRVHALGAMTSRFEYALFVTNDITMKTDAQVDGYDTSVDLLYGGTNAGLPVQVGSNTTLPHQGNPDEGIQLGSGVVITGDVAVGPGADAADVITGQGEQGITGLTSAMGEPYQWAEIEVPTAYEVSLPPNAIDYTGAVRTIGLAGSPTSITDAHIIECGDIRLGQGAVLEIYGPVQLHVRRDVRMIQSAELRIKPNSYLWLYVDGAFNSTNANLFNNETMRPGNFILYGTGSEIVSWDIGAYGDFYGVIYAPNVELVVRNTGTVFGAVAARSCDLRNGGSLHYDKALADPALFPAGYAIIRWWEEIGP